MVEYSGGETSTLCRPRKYNKKKKRKKERLSAFDNMRNSLKMGLECMRHSSQPSRSLGRASGWQAKMDSIEFWISWRRPTVTAHGLGEEKHQTKSQKKTKKMTASRFQWGTKLKTSFAWAVKLAIQRHKFLFPAGRQRLPNRTKHISARYRAVSGKTGLVRKVQSCQGMEFRLTCTARHPCPWVKKWHWMAKKFIRNSTLTLWYS